MLTRLGLELVSTWLMPHARCMGDTVLLLPEGTAGQELSAAFLEEGGARHTLHRTGGVPSLALRVGKEYRIRNWGFAGYMPEKKGGYQSS